MPGRRGEGYAVREDEVGRFKEWGFQRGEGLFPLSGGNVERSETKGVGEIEIPLPLGGPLVTFWPLRKSLARGETFPVFSISIIIYDFARFYAI